MGLFNKNETVESTDQLKEKVSQFLLSNEQIESIYPLVLDFLCLTNKRIIFVNKDINLKTPKTSIYSVAYKNIDCVSIEKNEKAIAFTDKLEIVTKSKSFELKFLRTIDITDVYKKIVEKTL